MKLLVTVTYLMAMVGAVAQTKMAPIPSVIIIFTTNQSATVTVIHTSADSWRVDYVKQKSAITNLNLTCMSVKSLTTKSERETVSLVLHGATVYGPAISAGNYGSDQKLQKMIIGELSLNLGKDDLVQVNDEILNADRFSRKFKTIPETKNSD
jgi:hypothetical protein